MHVFCQANEYAGRVADPFDLKGRDFDGLGRLHFITFTCYRRLPLLRSVHARNVFVQILGQVRDLYAFYPVGCVVMPEQRPKKKYYAGRLEEV